MSGRYTPRRLVLVAGALPLLLIWPLYRSVNRLYVEIGLWRTVGVFEVLAVGALALWLLAARLLPAPRRAAAWLVLVTVGQLALVGLTLWFYSPRLAPAWTQALTLAAWTAFALAFWRKPAEEQAFVARVLATGGALCLAGLALAAPVVAWRALADRTLTSANPPPPPATAALPGRPARVVLLTLDGLRYRSAVKLPRLAALAAQSTWYDNARAIADATLVSVPVILTGSSIAQLAAARTAWHDKAHHGSPVTSFMREGMATGLAGYLEPAGYRAYYATMLIYPTMFGLQREFAGGQARARDFPTISNAYNVRAYLPFGPIFAGLRGSPPDPPKEPGAIAKTFADALAAYRRDEPYVFVWAHLGGAHAPFRRMERGPDGRLHPVVNTDVSFWKMMAPDDAGVARLEALYEDNVRYLDQELGDFLAKLQADSRWGSTLLVLTADHGQDFSKNATPHGTGLMTEGLTHVPLVIHDPGQLAARREAGPATSLDVVPSVLARVYRNPPSFPGLALGSPPIDRMVYAWGLYRRYSEAPGSRQVVAAYRGRYKYTLTYPARTEELLDWTTEPPRRVEGPAELARLRTFVQHELPLPDRHRSPRI